MSYEDVVALRHLRCAKGKRKLAGAEFLGDGWANWGKRGVACGRKEGIEEVPGVYVGLKMGVYLNLEVM